MYLAYIQHGNQSHMLPVTFAAPFSQGGMGSIAFISEQSHKAILAIKGRMPKQLVGKTPLSSPSPLQREMAALDRLHTLDREARYHWPPYAYLYDRRNPPVRMGFLMPAALCDLAEAAHGPAYQPLFSEAMIAGFCKTIFEALSFLHQQHMAHGDIKGKNVLVIYDHTCQHPHEAIVRLSDFNNIDTSQSKTNPDTICFTRQMLPESVRTGMLSPKAAVTWVHVDRYAWALMTCWELSPRYHTIHLDTFLSQPQPETRSHPEWHTIRMIIDQERGYMKKGPWVATDLLGHLSDQVTGWAQRLFSGGPG